MKSVSAKLRGFQLSVRGYEFPNLTPQDFSYDANWLVISAEIRTASGQMRLKDEACLLTWELADFARQLEIFSTPQQHGRWLAVLKPLEYFIKLRVQQTESEFYFQAQLRSMSNGLDEKFMIHWLVTSEEIAEFRQQLQEIIQAFPEKAGKKESL